MMFKNLRTVLALAPVLLAFQSMAADAAGRFTHPTADDPVVARIDDTEIRRSDVTYAQQLLPARYRKMPLEAIYSFVLKRVIDGTLVMHAARSEGLDQTAAVRRRLAAIERRLVESVYLERATKGGVTDRSLRRRYRAVTDSLQGSEEIRVRHILLMNKGEAVSVIEELADGADFATLARRKSKGPSSTRGGDLGYVQRDALAEEFAAAAFGLRLGQVTPAPIATRFGWHVIKLEDRRAAKIPSFEEMRPRLVRQIRARAAAEIVGKLRRNARIQQFDMNGMPMPKSASR